MVSTDFKGVAHAAVGFIFGAKLETLNAEMMIHWKVLQTF